jgi:hypothetical protein
MTIRTVVHCSRKADTPDSHERATRAWIASRLAGLLDYDYADEYDAQRNYPGRLYFVPGETLIEEEARALGINDEHDLFGGVMPYAFLTTKAIVHPVIAGGVVPSGWSPGLSARLSDTVLEGYTAFTGKDARQAGLRVLTTGKARIKPGDGIAGRGQTVVATEAELDVALAAFDADAIRHNGIVIEQNLEEVTTFSVGCVKVGNLIASYIGMQRLTVDNHDEEVYGGSDLIVVRGDFQALLAVMPDGAPREVVQSGLAFDTAVSEAYPSFFASRRNYDIAHGYDAHGKGRFGLLEQSWRLGGASPAEVAALEAFKDDPNLAAVRVCCVESYADTVAPPPNAIVYFEGADHRTGPLTKCVYIKDYGSAS